VVFEDSDVCGGAVGSLVVTSCHLLLVLLCCVSERCFETFSLQHMPPCLWRKDPVAFQRVAVTE
jgi:hypothetical protein